MNDVIITRKALTTEICVMDSKIDPRDLRGMTMMELLSIRAHLADREHRLLELWKANGGVTGRA